MPSATLPVPAMASTRRVGPREPLGRHRRGGACAHQRVVRAVADREREAGLGVRVDEDREHGGQVVGGVVLADRDPLARGSLRLLDPRGHHLPLALVAVEHDVPLRLHVHAPQAVHAEGVLDAVDVLRRREQADHVRAPEDQRLAIAPALHDATLGADVVLHKVDERGQVDVLVDREVRCQLRACARQEPGGSLHVPGEVPVPRGREQPQAAGDVGALRRAARGRRPRARSPPPRTHPPAATARPPRARPAHAPPAGASRPPRADSRVGPHGGTRAPDRP